MNSMALGGEPSPSPEGLGLASPPSTPALDPVQIKSNHDQIKAAFGATTQAIAKVDRIRTELTKLSEMGDVVTTEDVIKGAGTLVGHGIDAHVLAGIMADMPESGPQIAGWLATHVENLGALEQRLMAQKEVQREHLGHAGMQLLMSHVMSGGTPAGAPSPSPSALPASLAAPGASPLQLGGQNAS
jgi:hypothetical protein